MFGILKNLVLILLIQHAHPFSTSHLKLIRTVHMNRTEEQLDDLIQELGKHHGEDNFAIVRDIVLANASLPEAELFESVATILGDSVYVRVPRILQRPKNDPQEQVDGIPGNVRFPPSNPLLHPHSASNSDGKIPHATYSHRKGPKKHIPSPKIEQEEKPIQSIWKTVVEEHQADIFIEKPLIHNPDVDTRFEEFDVEQLEDVDPVALVMQENPDFFTPVIPDSPSHSSIEAASLNLIADNGISNAIQAQNSGDQFSVSKLSSQTLMLGEIDETGPEAQEIPAYLLSSIHGGLQKSNSSNASIAPVDVFAPSHPTSLSSSSSINPNNKPNTSVEYEKSQFAPTSIDFYLPAPPATEEEAKRIKERLNVSIRASSYWGASGDYGIAPAPSRLRESLNSSMNGSMIEKPHDVIDLTDETDFQLDTEALDFLGQIFPDFEVSYLADCLRGANNDVQLVSDFLMPVLMEEIEIDTDFNEEPYDYAQHMRDTNEYPQYQFPSRHMDEEDQLMVTVEQEEIIEISDEEELPEEDAAFNANYHALVEIYPEVDRDWVLDALINTENNLERAADLLMRGLVEEVIEIEDGEVKERGGQGKRRQRGGRRGKNRRGRIVLPLGAPNAWARPLATESSTPLSEYPVLSAYNDMEVDPVAVKGPIRIRPPQPSDANSMPSGGAELLLRGTFGPRNMKTNAPRRTYQRQMDDNIEAPRYISNEGQSDNQNWALMVVQANLLFERSSQGASNAVAAFQKNRAGARYLISALQATNESWISLMEQAGKSFYLSGLNKLDLHSLRLRPASKLVAAILQAHWEHGSSERVLTIISGRGAHSSDGISRIKEDVKRQVAEYEHTWVNPGAVRLILPKPLV